MPVRRVVRGPLPSIAVVLAVVLLASSALAQQETQRPKVEIFGAYAWMNPGGPRLNGIDLNPSMFQGWGAGATFNVYKSLGFTLDGGAHYEDLFTVGTVQGGPRLKLYGHRVAPFVEALFGLNRLSVTGLGANNKFGFTLGAGADLALTRHLDWRMLQADYLWGRHTYPAPNVPQTVDLNSTRLRTGLVLKLGGAPPPPPMSVTCSAQPTEVFDGEPVTVTATAANIPKKHTVTYSFNTTGGKLQAKENVATIDTTGLTPNTYKVTATVTDPKAKKAPPATCDASFTVKERPKHPPSIACSASPTSVKSGEPATITCTVQNPDNRPLTYDWNATGGKLTPNQTTATLDTAGASPGPISITSKATDDRGLSASTTTTVTVEAPPPPPPEASKINEIAFKQRSARVDNTAKAILDDVALRLQRDADAKAVIVGFWDPATEKRNGEKLAAQRAVNTKAYLVQEKGIDGSRIEVRTGTAGGTRAEVWLVPAGATFNAPGTSPVDETKVKAAGPARRARAAKKAAPAKPAPKP